MPSVKGAQVSQIPLCGSENAPGPPSDSLRFLWSRPHILSLVLPCPCFWSLSFTVLLCLQEHLPTVPLSGMYNKSGGKVRLTFKLEQDQLWIGTKGRFLLSASSWLAASGTQQHSVMGATVLLLKSLSSLCFACPWLFVSAFRCSPSVWPLFPHSFQSYVRVSPSTVALLLYPKLGPRCAVWGPGLAPKQEFFGFTHIL